MADDVAIALAANRAVVVGTGQTDETALLRCPFRQRAQDADREIREKVDGLDPARPDTGGAGGDLLRHLAAVREYLDWVAVRLGEPAPTYPDSKHAAELLDEAVGRYRTLTGTAASEDSRPGLIDKFGLAVASFGRATVLRRTGRLPEARKALTDAREHVSGSGFDYATGIICAESALVGYLEGTGDPMAVLETELDALERRGLVREAGYVMAAMACLLVSEAGTSPEAGDDLGRAERLLRTAGARFGDDSDTEAAASAPQAFYPPGAEVERVLDIAITHYRRGLILEAVGRGHDALAAFCLATQTLNCVPAGWYQATYQADPLEEPFRRIREAARRSCLGLAGTKAARPVLGVAENLRRSSLAGFLRGEVRKVYAADIDQLVDGSGAFLSDVAADLMIEDERGLEQPEADAPWQVHFSESFVDAFYAPPVDGEAIDQAISNLGERHGLVSLVGDRSDDGIRGVSVWVPPAGRDPVIQPFELTAAEVQFVDRLRRDPTWKYKSYACTPRGSDPEMWLRLAGHILPAELRMELLSSSPPPELVIVPDGILGYLPWSALMVDCDHRLVQCVDLAFVPSLTLLGEGRPDLEGGARRALVGLIPPFHQGKIRGAWSGVAASRPGQVELIGDTLNDLNDALSRLASERPRNGPVVQYLVTHGSGDGAGQTIAFAAKPNLTAIGALFTQWPEIVLLTSCHVGSTHFEPGTEPIGLPMACLAAGASVFIAGVHQVAIPHAAEFHRRLINGLFAHDPVHALAEAQRAWLAEKPSDYLDLANWAALQAYTLG